MKERFENPPLREIIAELTWDQHEEYAGQDPSEPVYHQAYEETFNEFLDKVGERGYTRSERLIPANFPCPPAQVVLRARHSNYRKGKDVASRTLYQMGMGVFTVNAVPPYESWEEFSPLVEDGLEDFLHMSLPGGQPEGFRLKLRYINAFGKDLVSDKSHKDFLQDALGVSVNLPETVIDQVDGQFELPLLDVVLPLGFGNMKLRFAKGLANDEQVYIFDLTISYSQEYKSDLSEIMQAFSMGRNSIHHVFINITKNLHKKMGLRGDMS
ncbi:TIGR04255 family protein [Billgrantia tianxiuensis]|jgi:uncharacterized protein (TIGR04255 family)|uniref:TIGR04255 family protein n=1 Tax=Billgrantia tianxiuensis TaxID=2497861 RepID=A0A6I6SWE2_9GAMM|nr:MULTISPECIES: TIGR04255 family protein [Halomonas]MCE8035909.1 TIGR04255 family protein [Halomonas sp. MCCC 1A11057]QHC51773.1 TIGR04255 family protein [Halomonas tianxiuensis]